MRIFVITLPGKKLEIEGEHHNTIDSIKEKICQKEGTPPDRQRLIYAGKQMMDGHILADYKVQNEGVIYIGRRLRGGGSEATPFVEAAQEQETIAQQVEDSESSDEETNS